MSWRSGIALTVLGLIAGALAFSWLSSAGLMPWGKTAASPALINPATMAPSSAAASPAPILPIAPQFVQPIADSARTEAMLVAMATRRALAAGAPLGTLGPRLNAAFAQSQPDALAKVTAAANDKLTTTDLLREFDTIAPALARGPETSWASVQREVGTLFVIRRAGSAPEPVKAQIDRARDYLASGNVEGAVRFIEPLPGVANARGWLMKARRYIDTQKALVLLEQAALAVPPTMPSAPPPAPLPVPDPVPLVPAPEGMANP